MQVLSANINIFYQINDKFSQNYDFFYKFSTKSRVFIDSYNFYDCQNC